MKLRDWRKQSKQTIRQLALQCGVSEAAIRHYETGVRSPKASIAKRIEAATNGQVTAAELLGLASPKGLREEAAPFEPEPLRAEQSDLATEARALGLDPQAIANKAIEAAVKKARIEQWNEDNREAIASWDALVEREGLWSDGLRSF